MRQDPWRDSNPDFMPRLSMLKFSTRLRNLGLDSAAARPLQTRLDFCDQSRYSATLQTKAKTARLSRPRQIDFCYQCGDGTILCPPWSGKSRRLQLDRDELIFGRAVSVLVSKVPPSVPLSGNSRSILFSQGRLHSDRLSRATSSRDLWSKN